MNERQCNGKEIDDGFQRHFSESIQAEPFAHFLPKQIQVEFVNDNFLFRQFNPQETVVLVNRDDLAVRLRYNVITTSPCGGVERVRGRQPVRRVQKPRKKGQFLLETVSPTVHDMRE